MIKIPVKLINKDKFKKFSEVALNKNIAIANAKDKIREETGCDDVLISSWRENKTLSIAFNSEQDLPQYKKYKDIACGLYIHNPRANSKENKLLNECNESINKLPNFSQSIRDDYKEFDKEILDKSNTMGFTLNRCNFGLVEDVIFGNLVFKDGEVIEIHEDWVEITASEMARLMRKTEE